MSYKTIAVWLNRHRSAPTDAALHLAGVFDAHVTALSHAEVTPLPAFVRVQLGDEILQQHVQAAEAAARAAGDAFNAAARRAGVASVEVWPVRGDALTALATSARYADLVVIGQADPDTADSIEEATFPDYAVLACGRPVLLVPYAGSFPVIGAHVAVAWTPTRESTRAVTDALPLLKRANKVTVIVADAKPERNGHGADPGTDIALFLARHGVKVTVSAEHSAGIDIGSMLLSRIGDIGADLLVMGGYGHSRLREVVLGGVTRRVLQEMIVPVLMSH